MGYTHYWKMPDKLLSENALKDVQKVLDKYQDIIQVEFNETGKAIVDKDVIKFNGKGKEGHETFYLAPAGQSGFCKTNGKPYDIVVCETLLTLKHHYGDEFDLSSDGFYVGRNNLKNKTLNGTWNKAIDNVKEDLGYEFELVPVIDGQYYSFDINAKVDEIGKETKLLDLLEYKFDQFYENDDIYEMAVHTDGGVEMWITLHKDCEDSLQKQFEDYIENFNVDEEIDIHRESEEYKDAFTIRESLGDFESHKEWLNEMKDDVLHQLKNNQELNKRNEYER